MVNFNISRHIPLSVNEFATSSFWFGSITAVGAVVGILIAALTYRSNSKQAQENFKAAQLTRNQELLKGIIVPLIEAYDSADAADIAIDILDDAPYVLPRTDAAYSRYKNGIIDKGALQITLRDHEKDQTSAGEDKVRNSFDELLAFFARLEYTMALELVKREQLYLFNYFIEKAAQNPGVVNFIQIYKAPLYGNLDSRLNCKS
jgi:hypothetical protein